MFHSLVVGFSDFVNNPSNYPLSLVVVCVCLYFEAYVNTVEACPILVVRIYISRIYCWRRLNCLRYKLVHIVLHVILQFHGLKL